MLHHGEMVCGDYYNDTFDRVTRQVVEDKTPLNLKNNVIVLVLVASTRLNLQCEQLRPVKKWDERRNKVGQLW
jgi:hypothetical protein